jgi:DnaA family protein
LNACAHYARSRNIQFHFYDAAQLIEFDASEFEGFEHCDVLAIDNLDAIVGLTGWESRFYQVINRCREGDFRLIYSLSGKPEMLETVLPDLRSRLQWGLMLHMPDSEEAEVGEILSKRARLLGIELSNDVIAYLLTHHSRNLASQMAILQTLDGASLSQRRRVTIPLIKQALSE